MAEYANLKLIIYNLSSCEIKAWKKFRPEFWVKNGWKLVGRFSRSLSCQRVILIRKQTWWSSVLTILTLQQTIDNCSPRTNRDISLSLVQWLRNYPCNILQFFEKSTSRIMNKIAHICLKNIYIYVYRYILDIYRAYVKLCSLKTVLASRKR